MQTMYAITNQHRVQKFGSMSLATVAKKDAAVIAEASLVHEHQVVRGLKALLRKPTKFVDHAEPANVLAVTSAKTRTTNQSSWTQQCQRVTFTPSERPDGTAT